MLRRSQLVPRFGSCESCEPVLDMDVGASEKGIANVRLRGGTIRLAELHWYEAHGIGKVRMNIKRYLD